MFILMINLGDAYIIWDKAASIDFIKPGRGTVYAEFSISKATIRSIKEEVDREIKKTFTFPCEVRDGDGNLIARLTKDVYVRKKERN